MIEMAMTRATPAMQDMAMTMILVPDNLRAGGGSVGAGGGGLRSVVVVKQVVRPGHEGSEDPMGKNKRKRVKAQYWTS